MTPNLRKRSRPTHLANGAQPAPAATKVKKRKRQPDSPPTSDEEFLVVDDLLKARAKDPKVKDEPILYYPSSVTAYVGYSPSDLYRLSNQAAAFYNSVIPQRKSSDDSPVVVALLGPSNFEYLISLLALSKLGHTLLFLSPRISEEAHVSLIDECKAEILLASNAHKHMGKKVQKHFPTLQRNHIASRSDIEGCEELHCSSSGINRTVETNNVAWIIHSSGSTGLPKPIYQTHATALNNFKSPFKLIGFVTLPLFHMQGLGCVFRSIMNHKHLYLYPGELPLTSRHLIATLKEHPDIQILYAVPYTVKLLADNDDGIELCRKLEVLFCGGAACPKSVGDKFVQAGVNLVAHFGSTETGQLMNSFRPRSEIQEWDWLRPSAALEPFLRWEPHDTENNIFELVVLEGWPSKNASNREDGAYATKDLWERHPDFPAKNAWRYHARKDDTIVLVNGEKANPLVFEDLARESPLLEEAIVFGAERPHLGMFVVACDPTPKEEEIVEAIWPTIEKGNVVAPAHGQLTKDMIRLLSSENAAKIRRTDKANLIRSAFYKDFAPLINDAYVSSTTSSNLRVFDQDDVRSFLQREIEGMVLPYRKDMVKGDTDLFSLGIDSLQASRIHSAILKNIALGEAELGENFVFDFPSIDSMIAELIRMQTGAQTTQQVPVEERMQALIDKYSFNFERHKRQEVRKPTSILVTGATGSLGVHLVAKLSRREDVPKLLCPIRARSNDEALQRLKDSSLDRKVEIDLSKVVVFASDFNDLHLGLSMESYQEITTSLRYVIHCAWNVNFNLSLDSFEEDCIKGTRHLIDLCLKARTPRPADFVFCSSISTVGRTPATDIAEELPASLSSAQNMGYAQSKLVAEHIGLNAAKSTGLVSKVLRIGQIVGDTEFRIWNRQEAIPMILHSAKTVGALPHLDEWHSWLPVDTVAAITMDISFNDQKASVFNVVNPKQFHWTHDLLPLLKELGMRFETVDQLKWLQRLGAHPDPIANPPYKLMQFFAEKYGTGNPAKRLLYASDNARSASSVLERTSALDRHMVRKSVEFY